MSLNHYIAEQLWKDQEQEWERRVRRGEFIEYGLPKASFFKKWFSSRKVKVSRLSENQNSPNCSHAETMEK
ncbi:hypothetical protein [Paenibacillus sp. FJAT-27812]|uniref:hypothetical protein n=1 Tax=Paenibacillus sp. FJAT-27812 TaxID=1684143 RepID=UPI0006A79404|nr:hypothetical protein [Paenibacillus sp. FJAT-27812]